MDNAASIGTVLRTEREKRGLSLEEVHDATKITAQNLAALEEDRFDSFPNKVYARAFLRDYANYLDLDNAELLARYEDEWGGAREVEVATPAKRGSAWRTIGYVLLVIVILGAAASAAYFSGAYERFTARHRAERRVVRHEKRDVAELPKAPDVKPKPATAKPKPSAKAKPAVPAVPRKLVIEVTVLRPVWADIQTDGNKAVYGNLPAGIKTVEAQKTVFIKVGQADAVRIKMNGVVQPPLGNRAVLAKRTYTLPAAPPQTPAAPANPATDPAAGGGAPR